MSPLASMKRSLLEPFYTAHGTIPADVDLSLFKTPEIYNDARGGLERVILNPASLTQANLSFNKVLTLICTQVISDVARARKGIDYLQRWLKKAHDEVGTKQRGHKEAEERLCVAKESTKNEVRLQISTKKLLQEEKALHKLADEAVIAARAATAKAEGELKAMKKKLAEIEGHYKSHMENVGPDRINAINSYLASHAFKSFMKSNLAPAIEAAREELLAQVKAAFPALDFSAFEPASVP